MQTVILAGGLGTRLRPLTNNIPKPMVLLNGKPYLEYQIEYLKQFGFTDIVLAVGYLGEQIESYFGDGDKWGVSIQYSHETIPLGTAGGLKHAEKHISTNEFLFLNGDSFLPMQLTDFTHSFLKRGKSCLIAVYDNQENTHVKNNIKLDDDGDVCLYEKEGSNTLSHVDSGVLCLKKDILSYIKKGVNSSLESDVFPQLIKNKHMAAYIVNTRFYDIGTPERLTEAEIFFKNFQQTN